MTREQRSGASVRGDVVDGDPVEFYENAPCGYLSTTPDGLIVSLNATLATWLDYDRDDLVGRRSFVELLSPGGRIYHETHYAPSLRMHGGVREIAFEMVRSDGTRLPVLVNAVLDRVDDEPRQIRLAVFDATERRRYEEELLLAKRRAEASEVQAKELARILQESFIPPAPPRVPGLDIGGHFRPADNGAEIGGDFYDIFQVGNGDWMVAMGDVCGKGVDAAVVTSLVRHTIRALASTEHSPRAVLDALNRVLLEQGTERFCTVVVVSLRRGPDRWSATVCAAGHPLPLLVLQGETPDEVGVPGTLLGVLDEVSLEEATVALPAGSDLLLMTDGVLEARRGWTFFDLVGVTAGLCAVSATASDLADGIGEAAAAYHQGSARDDIAVVAVRVLD